MTVSAPAVRPKPPRVGGEIDAYCTKCRLDLNHRIIAMVDNQVKRVECLTCKGDHNYRRPKSERDKEEERKAMHRAIHAPKDGMPTRSIASKAERGGSKLNTKQLWEKSIAGQPPSAFKAYNVKGTFSPGELIRHTRFGDGVVARIIDPMKVEILFEDGPRTMAQGLTS
ncbi:MAG: hypothetical protein HOW73_01345 [Polyangiaceae bacterium]|nr:hypothetical protein [Polyangiaceae bacterium]